MDQPQTDGGDGGGGDEKEVEPSMKELEIHSYHLIVAGENFTANAFSPVTPIT
eukprot:CAMPEP_0175066522 /NCGR_PEP_ID=MMETSP0052_2-20121109/16558_1 /TAXON_ID=51329 ORGANISM="Polytomella parva, Strain SAG 63-3" /NCGR_SAMPLE_ID=MMETSP0052_2 /ASSEMBLY_ACC=CAM_ASM_000194 /LENGTH=52 /DNA_ID=CAMNT_0016333239 /DNA_START=418 /DNA_END=572 /DNA_ORIENTATION=+